MTMGFKPAFDRWHSSPCQGARRFAQTEGGTIAIGRDDIRESNEWID
jgi:hypothetical protein